MKKFQKLFVAGTSLLIVCFMAVAGVFAFGTIARDITITIHFSTEMSVEVWAATYSAEGHDKSFYQKIDTHDGEDFDEDFGKNLYERGKDSNYIAARVDEFINGMTDDNDNVIPGAGFKFDEDGVLEVYFLIKNHELNQLKYYTKITYGDDSDLIELSEYSEIDVGEGDETEQIPDVTKSTPLGTEDEPNYAVEADEVSQGKYEPSSSLVKLVFNIKDRAMTPSTTVLGPKQINIELTIDRA